VLYGNVPWNTGENMQMFQLSLRKPIDFPPLVKVSPNMKNLISRMLIFREEDRVSIKEVKVILDEMTENGNFFKK
jgi:hypothetical protein